MMFVVMADIQRQPAGRHVAAGFWSGQGEMLLYPAAAGCNPMENSMEAPR
jgi:hypothetical protein